MLSSSVRRGATFEAHAERGGRFQLAPLLEGARQKQLYLPDTCVLLTRFLSDDGVAEISDFMPVGDGRQAHDVIRRAKTVRGEVRFRMVCEPRLTRDELAARGSVPAQSQATAVRRSTHRRRRFTVGY